MQTKEKRGIQALLVGRKSVDYSGLWSPFRRACAQVRHFFHAVSRLIADGWEVPVYGETVFPAEDQLSIRNVISGTSRIGRIQSQ
jgi:hypothetical protein